MHPAAPRVAEPLGVHVETELSELCFRPPAELVVAECGEELAAAGESCNLARDHGAAAGGHRQHLLALHDRARGGHVRDEHEIAPLDMAHDCAAHRGIIADLTDDAAAALQGKMEAVTERIPPFERFYVEHRDDVFGYLRRLLGQRAEDAWQETFLRALRAYDRLEHGRHLRAWVFTIATNVAMDELRAKPVSSLEAIDEPAIELHRDAFKEIEHLTEDLPPTERAAVVLRYGYDLPYEEIATALGSNEQAARAAASSGVRRLRRTHERLA
jgi:RNA polymerase sigma factor (sigma-70 family)